MNASLMKLLDTIGISDGDKLEEYIIELREAAADGNPKVENSVYDNLMKALKELRPDSKVFQEAWERDEAEADELDSIMLDNAMGSINTVNDREGIEAFARNIEETDSKVDLIGSLKLNGHSVRLVYKNGIFVRASTRGRGAKGRGKDLTRHLSILVPTEIEEWKDEDLVEVRGELVMSEEEFDKNFSSKNKTPLSAVTSLTREGAEFSEIRSMSFVAFKVLYENGARHDSLEQEYELLDELGFEIPPRIVVRNLIGTKELLRGIKSILVGLTDYIEKEGYTYDTDGVVISVNDAELFKSMGWSGNCRNGNAAFKVGIWASKVYSSTIDEIVYTYGRTFITPKAKIVPVITANGTEVRVVPIYNVGVMERYRLIPGNTIYFKYGGETGVTACDRNGISLAIV